MSTFNSSDLEPGLRVKGSLKRHSQYWKEVLQANSFVVDIIENGYKIPFTSLPESASFKNNKSALSESKFVEETILEVLRNKRIYEVKNPFMVNPLSVAEDCRGKKRLILDLRYVN